MVRIQFDLSEEEYASAEKYVGGTQYRHFFGRNAFLEKVNRMEGRDSDATKERMEKDAAWMQKVVQHLIDSGKVRFNK